MGKTFRSIILGTLLDAQSKRPTKRLGRQTTVFLYKTEFKLFTDKENRDDDKLVDKQDRVFIKTFGVNM